MQNFMKFCQIYNYYINQFPTDSFDSSLVNKHNPTNYMNMNIWILNSINTTLQIICIWIQELDKKKNQKREVLKVPFVFANPFVPNGLYQEYWQTAQTQIGRHKQSACSWSAQGLNYL